MRSKKSVYYFRGSRVKVTCRDGESVTGVIADIDFNGDKARALKILPDGSPEGHTISVCPWSKEEERRVMVIIHSDPVY